MIYVKLGNNCFLFIRKSPTPRDGDFIKVIKYI